MRVLLGVLVAVSACSGADPVGPPAPDAGASDGGVTDGGPDGGVDPIDERFLNVLETPADLAGLDTEMRQGVKFLANTATSSRAEPLVEDCYFQNMNRFRWHLEFLMSFDELAELDYETYLAWVLRPASRRWWGGYVKAHPNVLHPKTQRLGIVTFTIYSDPGTLEVDHVVEVDRIMKRCIPFATELMAFLPESVEQKAFARQAMQALEDRGVTVVFPEQLVDGSAHQVYSPGEGYGTLRIVPPGCSLGDYGPRDIVIVESAPNDISVVQGLITRDPQNELSHTNLRLLEKGVPNVAVPRIYDAPYITALADSLVHLVVTEESFLLEPAKLEDAEAFWESRRPEIPPVEADLNVDAIGPYDRIGHDAADAYGAKAANLGELFDLLPEENRAPGFGIPFSKYDAFVKANGIDAMIEDALSDPRLSTDAAFKRERLRVIRNAIESAPFPPALLDEIDAAMQAAFGAGAQNERTKFRSSTNVEDLDELTGAGLYESKSGCLADDRDGDLLGPSRCVSAEERADKEAELAARRQELLDHPDRVWLVDIIDDLEDDLTKERTVARAVRKVWASLWNERAFDEREYYGVDHRRAYMGIAVNQSFVLERASAVAITQLPVDEGDPLYRVSSQVGTESVVRPDDPTAIAEVLTFRRSGNPGTVSDVRVQVRSSLSPDADVWDRMKLQELGGLLFMVHDHFAANVYPHLAPVSIDVELKHTRDGRIVIKQARPFVSFGPE